MNSIIDWFESLWNAIMSSMEQHDTSNSNNTPPEQSGTTTAVTSATVPVQDTLHQSVTSGPSKLDLWCKAAIQMEGANPSHNNPGNIRYVKGTWMEKLALGESADGFCIFKDYQTGYNVLRQMFINAATGKSGIYHPLDTLYAFYGKYAPASDNNNPRHYAEFVAAEIATHYPEVTATTIISALV